MSKNTSKLACLVIFISAFLFLNILENIYRPYTSDKIHFQAWTSDSMMQTIKIDQLRQTPLQSLWYLHKQPPMLDSVRLIAAILARGTEPNLFLTKVDIIVYFFYSIFYSLMAVLLFLFLKLFTSLKFSLLLTFVWIFNPSPIFYATLLEGTLLSSLLVLWFFYELFLFKKHGHSVLRLTMVSILLIYTRTVFQWYFFPLLLFSLILLKTSLKQILQFLFLVILLVSPLLIKQKILFGTFSTSTFTGYHVNGFIWHYPTVYEIQKIRSSIHFTYPKDADRYSQGDEYNTKKQYEDNLIYTKAFTEQLKSNFRGSVERGIDSFKMNYGLFWTSSSSYEENVIIKNIPWKKYYDDVFAGKTSFFIIIFSVLLWIFVHRGRKKENIRQYVAILIPVVYIFIIINVGNRYEWTEVNRLKFLLEPLIYIFITSQVYTIARLISIHVFGRKIK